MPLPEPNKQNQEKEEFVNICMDDTKMLNEFPDDKQRAAVCYSQWEKSSKASDVLLDFSGQIKAKNENKTLNKPFRTPSGPKKFSVYVKNEKGNVVKVNFGDPNMEIKRDDPERRKSFRARHNCDNPGPKWKARYWSCRQWRSGKKVEGSTNDYEWDGETLFDHNELLTLNPSLAYVEEEVTEQECFDCEQESSAAEPKPNSEETHDQYMSRCMSAGYTKSQCMKAHEGHTFKDSYAHKAGPMEDYVFTSKEEAMKMAEKIGMDGVHESITGDGQKLYIPGKTEEEFKKWYKDHDGVDANYEEEDYAGWYKKKKKKKSKMKSGYGYEMTNEEYLEVMSIQDLVELEASEAALTEDQKKLPPFIQKQILKKKNKKSEDKEEDKEKNKEEGDASLWENIRKKKKRMGKNYRPAKPGDKDYPKKDALKKAQGEPDDSEAAKRSGPKSGAQTPAKPSERKKGSDKNKPGSAGEKGGKITFSESVIKSLKEKVRKHNEKNKKKVTLSQLKKVYRRGAGAFSQSHRPGMTRGGWAMARVNMFLKMVRGGKVKDSYRKADSDIMKS